MVSKGKKEKTAASSVVGDGRRNLIETREVHNLKEKRRSERKGEAPLLLEF